MKTRGSWLDGRLSAGGALFYYGYDNYQVFRIASGFGGDLPEIEVINANDAEVYGAELDFRAEPLAGWTPGWLDGLVVSGRFGWQSRRRWRQCYRRVSPGRRRRKISS